MLGVIVKQQMLFKTNVPAQCISHLEPSRVCVNMENIAPLVHTVLRGVARA